MPHGKKPTGRHVVQETIKTKVLDPQTGRISNEITTIHYGFPKKALSKMVKKGLRHSRRARKKAGGRRKE